MRKIKELLGSGLTIFIYIFFIYGEVFGIIHSVKKHSTKDVIASIAIPPWAWWRSIEMWWHDDYADIDWNKRLSNDMQTCIYFITQASNAEVNKFELNEDMEEFSNKINKYPKDKLEFLLKGTRNYAEYSTSISVDLIDAINKYLETGDFEWRASEKTTQLEEMLKKRKLGEGIEFADKTIDETNKQFKENFPNDKSLIDYEQINEMKTKVSLAMENQLKEHRRVFKTLFNEEF